MAFANMLPKTEDITGASLSGVDGASNRTYTLAATGVLSSGVHIIVQGTPLMAGASADYTMSGETITFLNAINDTDLISIEYFVVITNATQATIATSTALKYATTSQLAALLGLKSDIPSWDVLSTAKPTTRREEVGTGDNSETEFWLDQKSVLSDTYTLSYGADQDNVTELTETTHYVLDTTTGKVTLTAAGVTVVGTNKIFAIYSYINIGFTDDYLISVLQRAEKEVDNNLNTVFTDGTQANPTFASATELQDSKGKFNREYFTLKRPLKDISSTLANDITSTATSFDVASGEGDNFPSSGSFVIGNEKFSYTGVSVDTLTGITRGVADSTGTIHSSGDSIHTTIIETSGTDEGSAPTWNVMEYDSEVVVDEEGRIFIYKNTTLNGTFIDNALLSKQDVANRIRITYFYGFDVIPVDLTRLTLLLAKKMLINDNIGSSLVQGRDEFNPSLVNVDTDEINMIISTYRQIPITNT